MSISDVTGRRICQRSPVDSVACCLAGTPKVSVRRPRRNTTMSTMCGTAAECRSLLWEKRAELLRLADALPSGRSDRQAKAKLEHELEEFEEAHSGGDEVGAFTEIGDIVYYCVKAEFNRLLTEYEVSKILASACLKLKCSPTDAFNSSIIKYRLRAEINHNKDDQSEREAITAYLGL